MIENFWSPPKKNSFIAQKNLIIPKKNCCPTYDGSISTIEPMTKKLQLPTNIFLWLPKKFGHQIG